MDIVAFKKQIQSRLGFIYPEIDSAYVDRIVDLAVQSQQEVTCTSKWSENDVVLITYGDSVKDKDERPLQSLQTFLSENLADEISCVHILPFFPYSSDDGFSVIDYKKVDPELGTWNDVRELCEHFDLMADLVINHISQHSTWFQAFLKGDERYSNYFIQADPSKDYSKVVRPRSLPLLSEYETAKGKVHVWTTFSADQIDLNFANPEVLYEMLKVLLLYIKESSRIIRLDAIAFLWKENDSTCLHLPQTHEVVKLMRDVMEFVNPASILLTETNVPNKENLSYFGNGDEAHMVYQFSLPPLLLHALHTGNSAYLKEWAGGLPELKDDCTYFNFTASHDGIGVRPLEGLLPQQEFDELVESMKHFGGKVSTKRNSDGSDSPYELNITYFDACKGTNKGADALQVQRFICSQTVLLSMKGVPALYIHSFTATPNYYEGVEQTGRARTINRMKWDKPVLEQTLEKEGTSKTVFNTLKHLIKIRKQQIAFHPDAKQTVLESTDQLFAVRRGEGDAEILCLFNFSNEKVVYELEKESHDLILAHVYEKGNIQLDAYQAVWLKTIKSE